MGFKGLLLLRRSKHLELTRVSKNQKLYGQGCALFATFFLFEYGSYLLHIRMFWYIRLRHLFVSLAYIRFKIFEQICLQKNI